MLRLRMTLRPGRWESWVTIGAGALVILVVVNMVLFELNRSLQMEINARQQYIQQSIQLEGLNREIIAAIANLAVRNKDDQLKTLLAQHGITITANPVTPTPPSGAPGPGPHK
jgi:hypothetical protein